MRHPLLLSLPLAASAARLSTPIPTKTVDGYGAISGPGPSPTAAPPRYASEQLLARDFNLGHDTCGFGGSDNPYVTYACYETTGTCEHMGGYLGCCTSNLAECSSTFQTACQDYTSGYNCGASPKTRCCDSIAPYCISWLLTSSETVVTGLDCSVVSSPRVFELFASPYSLVTSSSTATGGDVSDSTITSDSATNTRSVTSGTTTSSAAAASGSSSGSNSSTSVSGGVIAGGVVGGLAVLGLVGLGVFFIRKRYSTPKAPPVPPSSPPPPVTGPAELGGNGSGYPQPNSWYPQQGHYAELSQNDHMELNKYPSPSPSPVVEAPFNPVMGSQENRAELR
ncbi:hypothetical protein F5Y18DRAFT_394843 [Xylariaceae sp. FL1019]|nr:hypothetical protein F5Y18DRAFT_394843 [Xylariaceae sp. FL1019]